MPLSEHTRISNLPGGYFNSHVLSKSAYPSLERLYAKVDVNKSNTSYRVLWMKMLVRTKDWSGGWELNLCFVLADGKTKSDETSRKEVQCNLQ